MFLNNIELAGHSRYLIGGKANKFFEAKTVPEIKKALSYAEKENFPIFILGGGTNILFDDAGFNGLVLKPKLTYIKPATPHQNKFSEGQTFSYSAEYENVIVGAGTLISEILDYNIDHELSGLEWAGGLPGTLGGAIRGNAGCFGGEMKDIVKCVNALQIPIINFQFTNKSPAKGEARQKRQKTNSKKKETISFSNKECAFNYRDSVFKRSGDYIILEATLSLKKGDKKKIREAIQEKIDYRNAHHPMEYPNIGSIFKNVSLSQINADKLMQIIADKNKSSPAYQLMRINADKNQRKSAVQNRRLSALFPIKVDPFPVIHTARLIAEVGLGGVSYGGAMISPKHPNFIVNVQDATSKDVQSLIWLIKNKIKDKFDIDLEEEVIILSQPKQKAFKVN